LTVHLDNVVGVSNPRIRILDNHSAVLAEDVAGGFGLNSLLSIRVNVGIPVYIEAASVLGEIGSYKVSARLVDDDYANDGHDDDDGDNADMMMVVVVAYAYDDDDDDDD
jgi:hypothetical protein